MLHAESAVWFVPTRVCAHDPPCHVPSTFFIKWLKCRDIFLANLKANGEKAKAVAAWRRSWARKTAQRGSTWLWVREWVSSPIGTLYFSVGFSYIGSCHRKVQTHFSDLWNCRAWLYHFTMEKHSVVIWNISCQSRWDLSRSLDLEFPFLFQRAFPWVLTLLQSRPCLTSIIFLRTLKCSTFLILCVGKLRLQQVSLLAKGIWWIDKLGVKLAIWLSNSCFHNEYFSLNDSASFIIQWEHTEQYFDNMSCYSVRRTEIQRHQRLWSIPGSRQSRAQRLNLLQCLFL